MCMVSSLKRVLSNSISNKEYTSTREQSFALSGSTCRGSGYYID